MAGRIVRALGAVTAGALIVVSGGTPAAIAGGAQLAGARVPAAGAAEARTVTLGGGSGIVFGHDQPVTETYGGACTLTAVGYDRRGDLIGLTNAHCFYDNEGHQWPGDKVYFDESVPGTSLRPNQSINPDLETGVIGTVVYISGGNPIAPGPNGVGLDYAVIDLDESKVVPTTTIGSVTINRIGAPPGTGTIMCKQGRTTGITCGTRLADNGDYFTHTIWEMPGDSGSPVVVGQTLVGNQWVTGGSTNIVKIMAHLDARGGPGAGFTLPTGK